MSSRTAGRTRASGSIVGPTTRLPTVALTPAGPQIAITVHRPETVRCARSATVGLTRSATVVGRDCRARAATVDVRLPRLAERQVAGSCSSTARSLPPGPCTRLRVQAGRVAGRHLLLSFDRGCRQAAIRVGCGCRHGRRARVAARHLGPMPQPGSDLGLLVGLGREVREVAPRRRRVRGYRWCSCPAPCVTFGALLTKSTRRQPAFGN